MVVGVCGELALELEIAVLFGTRINLTTISDVSQTALTSYHLTTLTFQYYKTATHFLGYRRANCFLCCKGQFFCQAMVAQHQVQEWEDFD